jgi:hypothetical protein
MQVITFQGDLYSPDPAQDLVEANGRGIAQSGTPLIEHLREDCGTRNIGPTEVQAQISAKIVCKELLKLRYKNVAGQSPISSHQVSSEHSIASSHKKTFG